MALDNGWFTIHSVSVRVRVVLPQLNLIGRFTEKSGFEPNEKYWQMAEKIDAGERDSLYRSTRYVLVQIKLCQPKVAEPLKSDATL